MRRTPTGVALAAVLLTTAGLLTWATLGSSSVADNRAACDVVFRSDEPFYSLGVVSLDEGLRAAAERAERASMQARDPDLIHALRDFADRIRARQWRDEDNETWMEDSGFTLVMFLCNQVTNAATQEQPRHLVT